MKDYVHIETGLHNDPEGLKRIWLLCEAPITEQTLIAGNDLHYLLKESRYNFCPDCKRLYKLKEIEFAERNLKEAKEF